ncbi:hypothetical protein Pmani_009262 [Petrolisthes manimaculis]|uniref:Short transient receptor potential channel 4-associated protein n=1 Tax=Petrolisthes manimaculis TaxID=1843537 RepID=A0AAE1UDT0_9EUCA|nr:hypothetical protein Pmani_009262 [Petrolisthes manimaculis]
MSSRYLVKKRYKNLSKYRFYKKELSGHDTNMMFMVPEDGLNCLPNMEVMRALRTLEVALQCFDVQKITVIAQLKVLLRHLQAGQDESLGDASMMADALSLIHKHNGVKTLMSLLMVGSAGLWGRCCGQKSCSRNHSVGRVHATTLDVLRRLATVDMSMGVQLGESDEVLQILFSHMLSPDTYTKAITLVENLLIFRKATLQLNTIPGLDRLIGQLEGEYLANFCSILAITISDLDVYENKTLLYEQSKLRSNIKSLSPLRDINQEYILKIPHFLSRLVDFATKLPYEPRYQGLTMEVDHWMQLIEDSMTEVLRNHQSSLASTSNQNLAELISQSQSHDRIESLTTPMLQRVETVYVLGLLLLGKQRREVQAQLATLCLIPRLSDLFDLFIWKCETFQDRVRVPGHLSSCECSPEVALKIQFLRLVHSFCDQSEYRYLMLTPDEYQEVRNIHSSFGPEENANNPPTTCTTPPLPVITPRPAISPIPATTPPPATITPPPADHALLIKPPNDNNNAHTSQSNNSPLPGEIKESKGKSKLAGGWLGEGGGGQSTIQDYPAEQMCAGSEGLLLKIVKALKKETTGSTFRFWFSRAIESYLRSANPYADQVFLLKRGLLKHLAGSLLQCDSGPSQKEVLQSTFDLLGELLKFNDEAYAQLDYFIATEMEEKKLFSLVTKNLVDSNMLVRSLVLSHDCFARGSGVTRGGRAGTEFVARSRTLRHVATFHQRLNFLVQLIKTISVDTLTQENVSCLNTSLVILMLAHKHSELPLYLEALRSHVEPHLLTNLRALLRFWQTHYLHNKDKDCNTLQRSSGIAFDFWRETVATLVAENKLSPDCIYHYLSPEDLSLSRTS